MASRNVLPPDFRYVGLAPAPSPLTAAVVGGGFASLGAATLAVGDGIATSTTAVACGAAALVAAWAAVSPRARGKRTPNAATTTEVAMAIVPWGVLVYSDSAPRTLHWSAVQSVAVEERHVMRGGTPSVVGATVTVRTSSECLVGRIGGAAALERLLANLDRYSSEAARPVAGDLDGHRPIAESVGDPVVEPLIVEARRLVSSERGIAELGLPASGYRGASLRVAAPETTRVLASSLAHGAERPADPRPLAAILATLLDARGLVPDLLSLVTSPHPMVAATAKAAALRLGAPPNRAGAIDEVAAFLFEDDLVAIERFAAG